ncbi:MAG: Omp28-related outer membrane protein [Prevotella sp.]|nr:Omp28-related outer membrane protein [Prevotella sp.]
MKKFYSLFVLALLALTAQAQDDLTWWGYYTGTESTSLTGNNKVPGDYEAAMFVAGDGDLKGISIQSIRIQTRLSTSSSANVKFWIRTALDGENVVEVTPETVASSGYTTVTLPEAYALPETGAYVGYSFRVTQWWNEYEGTPVVYAPKSVEGGLYVKKPGEEAFTDMSSTGCFAAQIGFKAPESEMWWGNFTGTESTGLMGNNKVPGSYQAAMFVAGDGALQGTKIKTIRIQTRLSTSSSENVKFWIRTALDGENVVEVTPEAVASSGYTTVELPESYAIPATGCYVGYSFRVTQWWNEYEGTPVVYAKKSVEGGLYLMQPEETEFTDKSSTGCLAAQILVTGGSFAADAAQVADDLDDMVAVVGTPISVNLTLTNQGSVGVQSIDYTYTLDGEAKESHADLATPIEAMLGAKGTVTVELGAPQQAGQQEIEIQITKVNGNANGITGRKSKCSVVVTVLSESAPRKAVAEIFYNTSNGYAPRAIVGSQLLNQQENVIAFLIDHYSGALAVESYAEFQKNYNATSYTNKYSTYPVAEVNRAFTTDPYTGATTASYYGANHFAAAEVVTATLTKATEASVGVEAQWTDDTESKVAITATTTFMADFKSAPYRLAFVVIKDNVKETISNYITYYKTAYADDDMEEWRTNPYTNPDYVLNNVAVASSDVTGIIGSVPTRLTAGEEYTYEYELEVPAIESQEEATNARVVALLINKDTKEIVNAEIVAINGTTTGIDAVVPAKPVAETIYNLSGQRVDASYKGLVIMNGRKVVIK